MADKKDNRILEVRDAIDNVDQQLLSLLNKRASLSLEVGQLKAGTHDVIFKPFREKQVLDNLDRGNLGPIPFDHLRNIYREIFSSSRALQRPQRAGYLGPEGTFSYFAGVEFLGRAVDFIPKRNFSEVFRAVSTGECELGVIPLENSLEGSVGQSLDLFMEYDLFIQAELFCRISHCLLTKARKLADIRVVFSHPQPLGQCGGWLRTNLPNAEIIPTESSAAAARRASETEGAAAIGHSRLADLLDLTVLARGIEDLPDNWTRFVIIGPRPSDGEGRDKTSMLFTINDEPGALAAMLNVMAREGVNLKKLESRPLRGEKWRYVFFVDVECDLAREDYQTLVQEMAQFCNKLRILGSYPAGQYFDVSRDAEDVTARAGTSSDQTTEGEQE